MNELLGILREDELALVRETEAKRMAALAEDDLIALHSRIRRARNKHMKNYRRAPGCKSMAGVARRDPRTSTGHRRRRSSRTRWRE